MNEDDTLWLLSIVRRERPLHNSKLTVLVFSSNFCKSFFSYFGMKEFFENMNDSLKFYQ